MKSMLSAAAAAALAGSMLLPSHAHAAKTVKIEIPVPVGVASSSDGSRVWVAGAVNGAIYKIGNGKVVGKPVTTRTGNANFIDLWTTPSGGKAYLLDEDDDALRVMRWGSRKVISRKVGPEPTALTGGVLAGRKVLYVLNVGSGSKPRESVTVIDRGTNKKIDTWQLPKGQAVQVQSMALSPDGAELYLGNLAGQGAAIYVLSTATGKVVRRLKTAYGDDSAQFILEVSALAVDPSGRYVFAGALPGGPPAPSAGTYKLDAMTGRVIARRLSAQTNYVSGIAIAASRVVTLSGSSDDESAPGKLQVFKRSSLKRAQAALTVPPAVALAVSSKRTRSRAHLVSPNANAYWAVPFDNATRKAPGNG